MGFVAAESNTLEQMAHRGNPKMKRKADFLVSARIVKTVAARLGREKMRRQDHWRSKSAVALADCVRLVAVKRAGKFHSKDN